MALICSQFWTQEQTDSSAKKKSATRVGQRKPKRDPVAKNPYFVLTAFEVFRDRLVKL
jgi:hypothetical protein